VNRQIGSGISNILEIFAPCTQVTVVRSMPDARSGCKRIASGGLWETQQWIGVGSSNSIKLMGQIPNHFSVHVQ